MESIKKHYEITRHKPEKMAELKTVWAFLNILGYSTYVYALFISFANVDVFTRTVLSFVGLLFLVAKLVVYCLSARRKHILENLEIRNKKNDEKEKALSLREREIQAYEKENDIIKGFEQ